MWTTKSNGGLIWSEEAKVLLLKLIKKHRIVLSNAGKDRDKVGKAWQRIYIDLTEHGMPEYSVKLLRNSTWYRMRDQTVKIIKANKRFKAQVMLTDVQRIIKDLLDNKDKLLKVPSVSRKYR